MATSAPYADLPAPPQRAAPGGPYGDPQGWEGVRRNPDPWATDVMKALNGLSFPQHAAEAADVRFELRICKDGSLEPTLLGGASGPELKEALMILLRAARVPAPPPHVEAKMKSDCAKLRYEFRWSDAGIR